MEGDLAAPESSNKLASLVSLHVISAEEARILVEEFSSDELNRVGPTCSGTFNAITLLARACMRPSVAARGSQFALRDKEGPVQKFSPGSWLNKWSKRRLVLEGTALEIHKRQAVKTINLKLVDFATESIFAESEVKNVFNMVGLALT